MQVSRLETITFEKYDRSTLATDLETYEVNGRCIELVSTKAAKSAETVSGWTEAYIRTGGHRYARAVNIPLLWLIAGVSGVCVGELLRVPYVGIHYTITLEEALAHGYTRCNECGKLIDTDDHSIINTHDGVSFCSRECAENSGYVPCDQCMAWLDPEDSDTVSIDGFHYCDAECAEYDGWRVCEDCGEWVRRCNATWIESREYYVCGDCLSTNDYFRCESCGDWLHPDDAYIGNDGRARCYSCDMNHEDSSNIFSYHCYDSYSPIGDGLHLGVELETDGGDNEAIAQEIDAAFWHGEHDGSLNDGVELISQPMTIDYHARELPKVARIARDNGALSHDAGTCGFHVHISRAWYQKTIGMYGDVLAESRIRVFFASHNDELLKFSRRTSDQCSDWCKTTVYGLDDPDALSKPHEGQLKELEKATAIKRNNSDRYLAVNGKNYETIEIRLWRGSLNETTLLATIALTYAIARYAANHADYECAGISWKAFTAWALSIKDMPENTRAALREYMAEKGL